MRILALILFLALISCEERRSLELDSFEKEPVVYGIISTDNGWEVQLSYTKSIFDDSNFEMEKDAIVSIKDVTSGESYDLDYKRSQVYANDNMPEEGHNYELEIRIPHEPIINAQTYIPDVLDVDVNQIIYTDEAGFPAMELDIELQDNPEEENFYIWELVPATQRNTSVDPIQLNSDPIQTIADENLNAEEVQRGDLTSERPITKAENIFNIVSTEESVLSELTDKVISRPLFFSEADVDQGKITNTLVIDHNLLEASEVIIDDESTNILDNGPRFRLNVMAVSSDLFEFLQSWEKYKASDQYSSSISDPAILYSNIENGRGIFGGYVIKSFTIY